jgi:hypothetical protein
VLGGEAAGDVEEVGDAADHAHLAVGVEHQADFGEIWGRILRMLAKVPHSVTFGLSDLARIMSFPPIPRKP